MIQKIVGDNKLSAFTLPPLPETLPLAPLPLINDPVLRDRAFTHTSVYQVARVTHDLETDNYPEILDYEKLEYVGDAIIGVCADLLIHELHPNMRQGVSTMVHSHLVCNETLAQLADRYGLTDQLKTSQESQYATKMLVKTRGSLFESYAAGVFYDHLNGGPEAHCPRHEKAESAKEGSNPSMERDVASEAGSNRAKLDPPSVFFTDTPPGSEDVHSDISDDTSLELKTISLVSNISQGETANSTLPPSATQHSLPRTYGQAIDYVYTWLKPLYIPIINYTLQQMQICQRRLQEEHLAALRLDLKKMTIEDQCASGATAALSVYCMKRLRFVPEYDTRRAGPGVWRTTCTVTLLDGTKVVGTGERSTKKAAKAIASYDACVKLKIMKSNKVTSKATMRKTSEIVDACGSKEEDKGEKSQEVRDDESQSVEAGMEDEKKEAHEVGDDE